MLFRRIFAPNCQHFNSFTNNNPPYFYWFFAWIAACCLAVELTGIVEPAAATRTTPKITLNQRTSPFTRLPWWRTSSRKSRSSGQSRCGTTRRTRVSRREFISSPTWWRQNDCQQALESVGSLPESTILAETSPISAKLGCYRRSDLIENQIRKCKTTSFLNDTNTLNKNIK